MAQFFGQHQGFAQVMAVLFFSSFNPAVKINKSFDDGRLDAVHVAEDGLRKDTPVEAFTQGAVAGKHHIGLLDQRQDDLIANPFPGGKHNTRLTCHKSG